MDIFEIDRQLSTLPAGEERSRLRDCLEDLAERELTKVLARYAQMGTDPTQDLGRLSEIVGLAVKREKLLALLKGAPPPPRRPFRRALELLFPRGGAK